MRRHRHWRRRRLGRRRLHKHRRRMHTIRVWIGGGPRLGRWREWYWSFAETKRTFLLAFFYLLVVFFFSSYCSLCYPLFPQDRQMAVRKKNKNKTSNDPLIKVCLLFTLLFSCFWGNKYNCILFCVYFFAGLLFYFKIYVRYWRVVCCVLLSTKSCNLKI